MSGFGKFGRFLILLSVAFGYVGGAILVAVGAVGFLSLIESDDYEAGYQLGQAIYGAVTLVFSAAMHKYVKDVEKDK